MMPAASHRTPKNAHRKGGMLPALCNVSGVLLIVAVVALCLPVTAPRLIGYEIFNMSNATMEPEIPAGSAVFVRSADPLDVQVDEVIAFRTGGNVAVQRVVANDSSAAELKARDNTGVEADPESIPYDHLIGVMAMHLPFWGNALRLVESVVGMVYLGLTVACGVMLNMLAERMRERERMRVTGDDPGPANRSWIRATLMIILALVFVGSGAVVLFVRHNYRVSDEKYEAAAQQFVREGEGAIAPIVVDFDALRAVNEDVAGWIYCEGTEINYPVLHGESNDQYLRHDYTREYNLNGSIFVDAANRDGFVDANTIIYGHHMNYGAMFANLDFWADQAYYDEHPVMWLLTPEQDYQVVLVSGHHTSAHSDMYELYVEHDAGFRRFLSEAIAQSDFVPTDDATVNEGNNYVMLTTCAYIFDDARYVLHGKLVPVESVGGVPLR